MALIFITYDLKETPKDIHRLVKGTMISEYNYSDKSPTKKYQLPNTSLLKDDTTAKQAVIDLKATVKKHSDYQINDLT